MKFFLDLPETGLHGKFYRTCFSDLNDQETQYDRGGTSSCFLRPDLNKIFRCSIGKIEDSKLTNRPALRNLLRKLAHGCDANAPAWNLLQKYSSG
ncbi:hypothetical protein L596_006560 [Steinernema carpocapsae]|uniref:Uncharacterized protein n=1 Tax=Steinernema carpocapsae TaxID=34508 RepID=A0A4U8V2I5_STECR|nr:hypothetical protein L596_006554 [Steinernema carpocapsae]TMS40141.1 hypothetical protein L596_006560 [Steinernema carpocapsae]